MLGCCLALTSGIAGPSRSSSGRQSASNLRPKSAKLCLVVVHSVIFGYGTIEWFVGVFADSSGVVKRVTHLKDGWHESQQ